MRGLAKRSHELRKALLPRNRFAAGFHPPQRPNEKAEPSPKSKQKHLHRFEHEQHPRHQDEGIVNEW